MKNTLQVSNMTNIIINEHSVHLKFHYCAVVARSPLLWCVHGHPRIQNSSINESDNQTDKILKTTSRFADDVYSWLGLTTTWLMKETLWGADPNVSERLQNGVPAGSGVTTTIIQSFDKIRVPPATTLQLIFFIYISAFIFIHLFMFFFLSSPLLIHLSSNFKSSISPFLLQ